MRKSKLEADAAPKQTLMPAADWRRPCKIIGRYQSQLDAWRQSSTSYEASASGRRWCESKIVADAKAKADADARANIGRGQAPMLTPKLKQTLMQS
jgi:hypothetical protein